MSCVILENLPTAEDRDKLSAWLSLFGEVSYIDYKPNSDTAIITFTNHPDPNISKTLFMGHKISVRSCNKPNDDMEDIKSSIPFTDTIINNRPDNGGAKSRRRKSNKNKRTRRKSLKKQHRRRK